MRSKKLVIAIAFLTVLLLIQVAGCGEGDGLRELEHEAISFPYHLDYGWHWEYGAHLTISTKEIYGSAGYSILVDMLAIENGWRIVPYQIKEPEGYAEAVLSPASASIELGNIENGAYTLEIAMKEAIDDYRIHKTDTMFWIEQVSITNGEIAEKGEFEKHLNGFTLGFSRAHPLEVRESVVQQIMTLGADIVKEGAYPYGETGSHQVWFYYNSDLAKLRQVIINLAKADPSLYVEIASNTEWRVLSWTVYEFCILVYKLDSYGVIKSILLEEGLEIWSEDTWGGPRGKEKEVYYVLYVSGKPLRKVKDELMDDLAETFSDRSKLTSGVDFRIISYGTY